jgi:hypothetical protein
MSGGCGRERSWSSRSPSSSNKVVRTAKIAFSGRLAAAELLKYGVSHYVFRSLTVKTQYFTIYPTPLLGHCLTPSKRYVHDPACIEAAGNLLEECANIDGKLSNYFDANEKHYVMYRAMVNREDR